MAEWHPVRMAVPVEWIVRYPAQVAPIGVVRRLEFGVRPDVWFRAVTWDKASERRHLIGYFLRQEDAVAAVWATFLAASTAQHQVASRRGHEGGRAVPPTHSVPQHVERD